MELTNLIEVVESNGKGVRAYRECVRVAREQVQGNNPLAAAFFVLSIAAEKFVDGYDDQPLGSDTAEAALKVFKSYVETLDGAADDAALVAALNEVSADILNRKI